MKVDSNGKTSNFADMKESNTEQKIIKEQREARQKCKKDKKERQKKMGQDGGWKGGVWWGVGVESWMKRKRDHKKKGQKI